MTTAHRPTFSPAQGRSSSDAPTLQYSSKDLAAHTKLKLRENIPAEEKKELIKKLFLAENSDKVTKEEQNDADIEESDGSVSSEDEDEDEEDTAELLRELEKIKQERKLDEEKKAEKLKIEREKEIMGNNPLMDFGVKRKWDDDVIFRNQVKEVKPEKRFVNDTLRSDFHRRFISKYIQ